MIMLILLTLLAVAASQVSLLQERMAGSFRAQNLAFQRSEGAVAKDRDVARDPLKAYDTISDVPVGWLRATNRRGAIGSILFRIAHKPIRAPAAALVRNARARLLVKIRPASPSSM
jgi:hypothetical protein